MIQRINDCIQNDINPLKAMNRYGSKVTHIMTESTRTVLKVIQQDCTITRKGVVQTLNDVEAMFHEFSKRMK